MSAPSETPALGPLSAEPTFSIVTVCRNAMPQIGKAAASLLAQDYPHWEMVVVDALSTDGTLAHLASLGEPRVRIVSEADAGIYDAMNKGIARATGEILFFLNADDALHDPGVLRRVAEVYRKRPDAAVVYGDYMQVYGPEKTRFAEQPRRLTTLFFSFTNLVHQTMFIRRAAFAVVGNYEARFKLCADFYWNMAALCRHGLAFVHLPGAVSWFSMTGTHLSPAAEETLQKEKAACIAKFVSNRPPQPLQPEPDAPIDCWIWHTEQMGLSGIFTWLYQLRQRRDAIPGLRLRFVSLELAEPGFDQVPAPVESLYDLRVRNAVEFLEFLAVHGDALHLINHAFPYVPIAVQLLQQQARLLRLIGVCHTDQDFYYVNLAKLDPVLRGIIAVSPACRDRLEQLLPRRKGTIPILPAYAMPVPEPRTAPRDPSAPLRLIYMGRILQYQKRVFDLADLSRLLKEAKVPATLTIVGGGPDLEELKRRFSNAAEHIPVTFPGILPPWEVEALLPQHDLFVLTSEMEGASVSLIEAMAREVVPVITRTQSGSDFVRDRHNGITVPIGDMTAMAEAIMALAANRPALAKIGAQARADAIQFLQDLRYPERLRNYLSSIALPLPFPPVMPGTPSRSAHPRLVHAETQRKPVWITRHSSTHAAMAHRHFLPSFRQFGLDKIFDLTLVEENFDAGEYGQNAFNDWGRVVMGKNLELFKANLGNVVVISGCDMRFYADISRELLEEASRHEFTAINDVGYRACGDFNAFRVTPRIVEMFDWIIRNDAQFENQQVTLNIAIQSLGIELHSYGIEYWTVGMSNDNRVWNPGDPVDPPPGIKLHHGNFTIGAANKMLLLDQCLAQVEARRPAA